MNTILNAIVHLVSKPAQPVIDDTPVERRRRPQEGDRVYLLEHGIEGHIDRVNPRGHTVIALTGDFVGMPYPTLARNMICIRPASEIEF